MEINPKFLIEKEMLKGNLRVTVRKSTTQFVFKRMVRIVDMLKWFNL